MKQGFWTHEEDDFIRANPNMSNKKLAEALDRKETSVANRKCYIGATVKRNKEKWKGCDDDCFNCKYQDCIKPDKECNYGTE